MDKSCFVTPVVSYTRRRCALTLLMLRYTVFFASNSNGDTIAIYPCAVPFRYFQSTDISFVFWADRILVLIQFPIFFCIAFSKSNNCAPVVCSCSLLPYMLKPLNLLPEESSTTIDSPVAVSTIAGDKLSISSLISAISALFCAICSRSATISCAAACTACTCFAPSAVTFPV